MTLRQFLLILRARRLLFAAVFAAVFVPTLLFSLLLPKKYMAVASVVVEVKPDPLSPGVFQGMASPALMATQIDIIQSDRVARRVVRTVKLTENQRIREQWQREMQGRGDIETWVIERFIQKELDVRPSRESSVINIAFRANDPVFAAAMANAIVQAYVETALELRVDPAKQYSSFFDQRAKEARDVLEKAQTRLSSFQRENGVITTDERMDVESQRLNELSSQLVSLQSMSAEANSRQAQANSGSADKLSEVSGNPVVAQLRADVARAEAKLQELSARLGDNNPQVIELKANIAELRQKLDAEVRRLSAGVGVSSSISRQREAQTRAELDAQRAKVLRMKQVRDEGALILRDVENAQKNYDLVVQRHTQTNLESQSTSSNVSVLNPAEPPLEHASPRVLLNTVLGLLVGGMLGVGLVIGAELKDRRIRDVLDLAALPGIDVLGVVPGSAEVGPDAQARRQRLIGGSARPTETV